MGIPLLAGRDFSDADQTKSPMVVVLNHRAVEQYFAGHDPVGKRLKLGAMDSDAPWMTVIGVVGDVHHGGLQRDIEPYMYAVYPQNAWPQMSVTVRIGPGAGNIELPARAALLRVAPEQPVSSVRRMEDVLAESLGPIRFPLFLFSAFAVVALLLAGLGVFGVAAQSVLQRRRELGIRMALGARVAEVYRLILGQALLPVGMGMVFGLAGTVAAGRLLRGLLFGVSPTDPLTILAGAALLGAVALLASLWPATQATRVDPALVLRSDG
jgi:putative ABC transport system permease protein